jgi:alkanesulfonate monooxygenase SsuD/methylene tetrahydromethanopterin reductase-like flavin-dependent oxidoreductase (luciferase family)
MDEYIGQFTESVATVSDGSADDQKNRDIFEERVDMVLRCWENESVVLDGHYYQAPYPLETGVRNYPAAPIAAAAGAPGEIGSDGSIRRISVVPAPYQRPRPQRIMVATSKSDDSVRYCARKGFIPTYLSKFDVIIRQSRIYVEEVGSNMRVGQNQNIVRWLHIGESEADYHRKLWKYDVDIYKNFYSPFFPQFPADPNTDWVKNISESGIYTGGTLDQVRSEWQRIYEQVPSEYITLIFHFAQQPKDEVLRELEQFMTKVVPYLDAVGEAPAQAGE